MEVGLLILDYIKTLLSAHIVVTGGIMWLIWIFRSEIRNRLEHSAIDISMGGQRVQVSQPNTRQTETANDSSTEGFSDNSPDEHQGQHQIAAVIWEYRYLNHYLVPHTQQVLNWFEQVTYPISYETYDTLWQTMIVNPRERRAVFDALVNHYLIVLVENDRYAINDKGRQYCNWHERTAFLTVRARSQNPGL